MFIKSQKQYEEYLEEVATLASTDPKEGTPDAERLSLLALAVQEFESEKYKFNLPSPIEALKFRMEEQGLSQSDLIPYIGSKSKVSEVLSEKRPLSLNMIKALHKYLGIPAGVLIQDQPDSAGEEKVNLDSIPYEKAPLSEMSKRGWITATKTEISKNSKKLFIDFLKPLGGLFPAGAFRATAKKEESENLQLAAYSWAAFVVMMSDKHMPIGKFSFDKIDKLFLREVAKLSYFDNGPILAVEFLNKNGISVVIEKHLEKTKIDGGAFMSPRGHAVIGLTLRHDRLDNFWFTLLHELAHVSRHLKTGNTFFIDNLEEDLLKDSREREADQIAKEALIPAIYWRRSDALVIRNEASIKKLAEECQIHPSIVAGRVRRETNNFSIFDNLLGRGVPKKMLLSRSSHG